jgi:hypothetical protein
VRKRRESPKPAGFGNIYYSKLKPIIAEEITNNNRDEIL